MYSATINVPGYLPMMDDVEAFDTAQEAWAFLLEERKRGEDDVETEAVEYSDTVAELELNADGRWPAMTVGTVYGPTPGRESDHDLGLTYSVELV